MKLRMFLPVLLLGGAGLAAAGLSPDWKESKFRNGGVASFRTVETEGQPFKTAGRVTVTGEKQYPREVQLNVPCKEEYRLNGDVLEVVFRARCVKPLPGKKYAQFHVMHEQIGEPWTKLVEGTFRLEPGAWKEFRLLNKTRKPGGGRKAVFEPGGTHVAVNLAFGPQEVEFGPFEVINHGADPDLARLNLPRYDYPGREENAAWRKAAEERIEKLRKGDFRLKVVDADGKPVPGATVKVEMKRHLFPFGSCINRGTMQEKSADSARYLEEFPKLFNQAVFEGAMKWGNGWEYTDGLRKCVKFLKDNDITVRGHCSVWPSWRWSPKWLQLLKDQPEALNEVVRDHIYYQIGMLRDDVVEYDLVNEPFNNHDLMDAIGGDPLPEWYRTARQAAPELRLYLNETGPIAKAGDPDAPVRPNLHKVIRGLLDAKAPLGGIGLQGHFSTEPPSPEQVLAVLDEFAVYKLPIKITEYDIAALDEELAADYMRDILYIAFSHPAVEGFLMWGFWDGQHWRNQSPVYRKDWSLKPSGKVFLDLVHNRWKTRLEGKTGGDGVYAGRGFHGDYTVTVTTPDGRSAELPFQLRPGAGEYTLKLK